MPDLGRLFLSGDVMIGRGIDQIFPDSVDPTLHERYMSSATGYVRLAERTHGPIPSPVEYDYVWGVALAELDRLDPDLRLVNLETSLTRCGEAWTSKGIHYRMHPDNVACLGAAGIDVCGLANNHVLDWGYEGFNDTLETLHEADVETVGAGFNHEEARSPARVSLGDDGRILVFGAATPSSGVPESWAAGETRPGVNVLEDLSGSSVDRVAETIQARRDPDDRVILSIHWGSNWGFGVPDRQRSFARNLIDRGAVDLVHGHSSHHVKGIEVYGDRLIMYGCGDLISDYEGIAGHGDYRDDLGLMYFPVLDRAGRLEGMSMVPTQVRKFRLQRPEPEDVDWLASVLQRESEPSTINVVKDGTDRLQLDW